MSFNSINSLCIYHLVDGLRDGLSHFSHLSRAAVLYAIDPGDPIRVYDPQDLLKGHGTKLLDLYTKSNAWRFVCQSEAEGNYFQPVDYPDYQLTGLINCGGQSPSVFHQMWFTEQHPDMCSTGPTRCWLEYAGTLLSMEFSGSNAQRLYNAGRVLQQFATHAVRDYIVDERNVMVGMDSQLRIYPILDSILAISKTREEGALPKGALAFVEPSKIKGLNYLAKFPEMERPFLENKKHVRKLLQSVEVSGRKLISDGVNIVGIAIGQLPKGSVLADFKATYGFLYLDGNPICSFSDGNFYSTNRKCNLVQLEECLFETDLDMETSQRLFKIASNIVNHAADNQHGCTLVIDLNKTPLNMAGQDLECPLDLRQPHLLDLACSLSKVDGALHMDRNLTLRGFACLMDGRSVAGENRAKGARFNSALRFTAEHKDIVTVVVSSDRLVSVIQHGIELTAACSWKRILSCVTEPPLLEDWAQKE